MSVLSLPRNLLGALFGSSLARERDFFARHHELSDQIAAAPEGMIPRVLRGELLLERRDYALAGADFEAALDLTGRLDMRAGWLLQEQVMRDRALFGLEIVARHLPPASEPAANVEA